nr:MAG TPA_asm: hypothetical protein [Caudoviricetes sp.]
MQPRHRLRFNLIAQRAATTRKINPVTTSGAQCYPRLVCALKGSLLMQVH